MGADWSIYVRDRALRRVAQVSDFRSFEAVLKFNDIGKWTMEIDERVPEAIPLTTPGFGIQVISNVTGNTLFTGPIEGREFTHDVNKKTIRLEGVDDNALLSWRLGHPVPTASQPPYSSQENHVVTGTCSTVLRTYVNANLGPGANSERRMDNVVLQAADPLIGKTVTGKLRWQNLLTALQDLAVSGGGLGFRCVQVDDQIEFQVYEPVDRTETVKFGEELGNLMGYQFRSVAPETTYVYAGGQGEGTARKIKEGQNSGERITWGRREEFVDRRDTSDDKELDQKITETLEDKGESGELSITPIDTEGCAFDVHYKLGDKVTAILSSPGPTDTLISQQQADSLYLGRKFEGGHIQEVVREVKVSMTADKQRIEPKIGTPNKQDIFRLFREFRRLAARVNNLERR
ncbi:hypothetical protein OU415_02290 [Saccharopolyspora sp. WRP15-2]|uniref:Gp28/Gp37-like domain-containing protein n=1 Tax=Saccharopolyspora oryzae TaxID=2997343 RepID=A0ABT4URA3_9PSEU|nr:hypothetical protein [Saccharopolyspora oryzae]MDA3624246.1 hypothetical protein [Saccharopolyspora oryzae]